MIGIPTSQLVEKVSIKFYEDFEHRNAVQIVVEVCAIRDGVVDRHTLSYNNVCNLIE